MAISEKIISRHIIKPSSPTPNRFRNHKLSYLDQIAPSVYIPLIFFYQNADESKLQQQAETSQSLKQSLSQILTVFYPLAGTIRGNAFVDCDDTGVEFLEARVHARLAQVVSEPKTEQLKQLVPVHSSSHRDSAIVLVKISLFECGGIAVGVCLTHKIGDYASLLAFMRAWAATNRGDGAQVTRPCFDLATRVPPKDSIPSHSAPPGGERITTRRFVFDGGMLERLKQRAAASSEVKNPTRTEALTVFIWRNLIEVTNAKPAENRKTSSCAVSHGVNLRQRTDPPIPDHTFGNCSVHTGAIAVEASDEGCDLVSKFRAAVRAVDGEYLRRLATSDEYSRILNRTDGSVLESGPELIGFSSWWRFPVYDDVDFGWGKPVWVGTPAFPYNNSVILMSTPSRDGIEAWVNVSEDLFQILETNYNKLLN